jgi:hypothetical protein
MAHPPLNAYVLRARLVKQHGTAANQVIWGGPNTFIGYPNFYRDALTAMDRWLAAVEADDRNIPLPTKIVVNRPTDVADACFDGLGAKVSDGQCPNDVVPIFDSTRMVAGAPLTLDGVGCALRPPSASDYRVPFTDAQSTRLQQVFASGVCDYSRPAPAAQPTIPWLTYLDDQGQAVVGGEPLGPPPSSRLVVPGGGDND